MDIHRFKTLFFLALCVLSISCTHVQPADETPVNTPGTDAMRTTPEELETNMETHGVSSEEIDDPDVQISF